MLQLQKELVAGEENTWRYWFKTFPAAGSLWAKKCAGFFCVADTLEELRAGKCSVVDNHMAIREMRKRLEANLNPIT